MRAKMSTRVRIAALLLTLGLLAACAGTGNPSPAGHERGYLYRNGAEVLFIRLDGAMDASRGTVAWYHGKAQRITADFTLRPSQGGFAVEFPAGSMAGWTGTFTSGGLSLLVPDENGGLRTIALTRATPEAFDAAVAGLE